MSLLRRLYIFIFLMLTVTLIATLAVNLRSASAFLENQLSSHAHETAASLGLVLTKAFQNQDPVSAKLLVNAVFDQGYYSSIQVQSPDETFNIRKNLPEDVRHVPSWFVQLIPLPAPEAKSPIMSGWQEVGHVYVRSHPGYAYAQLWSTALRLALLFLVLALLLGILTAFALRRILAPMEAVTQQADGISRGQYVQLTPLPRIPELRTMVKALNRMTGKVEQQFAEQAEIVHRLQALAFRDPLTGLGNRRFLEDLLQSKSETSDEVTESVALLMIQIEGLQTLNDQRGMEAGDALIVAVGETIRDAVSRFKEAQAIRLGGGDFAVLLSASECTQAERLASTLVADLAELHEQGIALDTSVAHVGLARNEHGQTAGQLRADADLALRQAQAAGPNQWAVAPVVERDAPGMTGGRQYWRQRLEQIIREHKASLAAQPVVLSNGEQTLHWELFGRLSIDREQVSAGLAMPMAETLRLAGPLDRLLITTALEHVRLTPAFRFAVNLPESLERDKHGETAAPPRHTLHLELVGQDRPGIVHDIAHALAVHGVSIEELSTETRSASMGGGQLFEARATLAVPPDVALDDLRTGLEALADELMVDLHLEQELL